jgi:tetratricopeptide (TPR) repeat protein
MTRQKPGKTDLNIMGLEGKYNCFLIEQGVSAPCSKIIILLIILFSHTIISAQSRDEKILQGIDYVYHLKFDSAGIIFQSLVDADRKDPTGYFFQAMTEWWKIYLNKDDETNDDNYLSKVDNCIDICDERLDKNEYDDWALFLKGGVIGYRGFLNSIREKWLKAVDDGREGLSLIQRGYEINPSNKDALLGIGLYNYAAEYVTERYPFLKPLLLFFPKGNKELGLSQLKECVTNGKFSRTEAKVVLCFINLSYEKNYFESLNYASELNKSYPENPVFERFLGRSYVGLGRWGESSVLWSAMLAKIDSSKTGYSNKYIRRECTYYLGLTRMKTNELDEALNRYQESLRLCKELDTDGETAYQVFSALAIGMIYDLKGNHPEAIKYYDMVLDMKNIESSHDSAKQFKENPYR